MGRALEEPGAVAAEIARAAGVDRASCIAGVSNWRRRAKPLVSFRWRLPTPQPERVAELSPSSAITIEFSGGVRLKVEGAPDVGTLTRVIDALSRAERRR